MISASDFCAKIVAIESDEPLLGGAENHGIVAAPAVRIAVREFLFADEHAALLQQLDDRSIRLEDRLAFVLGQAFGEAAFVILRRVGFEVVFLASVEIFGAVARRGMNDSAALIERDVIGENGRAGAIEKRMPELDAFELTSLPSTASRW